MEKEEIQEQQEKFTTKVTEIIAALLINNMIPVLQGVYKRIDINNEYIYLKKQ